MIRLVASLLACALAASAAEPASARTITHEDLWRMPRVAAPVPSPDGRQLAFTVTLPEYDADRSRTDIWLVASDGRTPPRQITFDRGGESGLAWSRDGRRLAFVAKRGDDETAQVYVLDLDGGEARRVTDIVTGARAPSFSPDGRHLLFISNVPAGSTNEESRRALVKERKERKHSAMVYTGFPIRDWDRWREDTQVRVFVHDLVDGGEARDLLAGTQLSTLPGFAGTGGMGREEIQAVWAPDGQSIVFSASRNRDRSAWSFTHNDLWQVALSGGEPRRLTGTDADDAADSHGSVTFSGDGRRLFAMVSPRTAQVYNAARLVAFDWPSMAEVARIEAPERRAIGSYVVNQRGDRVWFSVSVDGQEHILEATTGRGEPREYARPDSGGYLALTGVAQGDSPMLAGLFDSAVTPPEVARFDAGRNRFIRLTQFTAERLAGLDLMPVEHFWHDNDGHRIHSMLVRPPGFDPSKKYPLFVLMHGGPHMQWRDQWVLRWNYHLLAARGHVVLLTNFRGSTNQGEAFAQAIMGDPLRGPADDINTAADAAIARHDFIDGERQCAGGASYGGHLANWLQGTTDRYRCLVSHAGLVNLEAQWGTSDIAWSREASMGGPVWEQGEVWRTQNPIRLAANFRTPTLVTYGEKDFRVPINNGLEYWAALQRQRVESRLVVFPDENHWILKGENSRYFYQEVGDWLARWLLDEATTTPAPSSADPLIR
ncbi:S9 family peptidase [Pseudofulvimonas gallinarii]|jgi:dipeptidyl aminopeptidase/acylaminoacyl peptidase|uniref:Dipeptidyl aminopeptidase/acylaminoacyl peptidase n=1 Tax=Pseudofulvimonas gallinarii TaxID=634155 RepID=A0A4S3L253_9GAMM|nr:S9 family peptidase [Pseudofulvimonas gallinarii]TCT01343.1 dipeptidyl aminopeptidase/acylaminoacyl peptidase [Pseudofulvimonas gallinarii]THD15098.1 prolyl oligopeptidase [Pseudofulvimonas gallinarii]